MESDDEDVAPKPVAWNLTIPNVKKWHELRFHSEKKKSKSKSQEIRLLHKAESLIHDDTRRYWKWKHQGEDKQDFQWISQVIRSGTFADKLAANTLLVQDSPIHNIEALIKLISMTNSKGTRECLMSMENVKELFIADLLPSKGHLKPFSESIEGLVMQPGQVQDCQLMVAYYEDKLRSLFLQFVQNLVKVSIGSQPATKDKAVNIISDLVSERDEQEQFLIETLTNKLGDPVSKRASHVAHLLCKIVNYYKPAIKGKVVKEIERLLYRPNVSEKCKYYSLCCLNEFILTKKDKELANQIIFIYFKFFETYSKKSEINNKMMNALLTGVSRTFPFTDIDSIELEKRLEYFYKLIHLVGKNTAIQGLSLIFNVLLAKDCGQITDRFYAVLYRSLLESKLENCSRKAIYLNLIYRALTHDTHSARLKAFVKRLLQETLYQSSCIAPAILILISELIKAKPEVKVKLSSATSNQKDKNNYEESEDDDDEYYQDVDESGDEKKADKNRNTSQAQRQLWINEKAKDIKKKSVDYDPKARNPLYSNADKTDYWELNLLQNHFHPTVNLYAKSVLENDRITYDGDALNDFSIKHFLDRFVFKNPKTIDHASKIKTIFGRANRSKFVSIKDMINLPITRVPIEERFIYEYLKKREQEKLDDNESVTSEDFEKLLEKYESNYDKDFASELNRKKKENEQKRKKSKLDPSQDSFESDENDEDEEDEDGDSDSEYEDEYEDDDDDEDIDTEDENYKAAFDDIDDDIKDAKKWAEDNFDEEEDDDENDVFNEDDEEDDSKFNRRGRNKSLRSLLVAADKFAHLLNGDVSDKDDGKDDEKDDDDDDDDDNNNNNNQNRRRGEKRKFGKRKQKSRSGGRKNKRRKAC